MNSDEYQKKIDEQAALIKELEGKLKGYTDVEDYYLEKYHEIFEEIKNSRSEEIKQELEKIDTEITILQQKKDDITLTEKENITIGKKINEIDEQLRTLYKELDVVTMDVESETNEISQIALQLYEQHYEQINNYQEVLTKYLQGTTKNEDLLKAIETIKEYSEGEGFALISTLKDNEHKIILINQEFKIKNQTLQEKIQQAYLEKESLIEKYKEITDGDMNRLQEEINRFTMHQEKYLEEMMTSFETLKINHEKQFLEQSKKMNILGYAKKEQGEIFDDLLTVFRQELLSLDSNENRHYQKEKRLKKLQIEAQNLKELDVERETLDAECRELQNEYLTKRKQVQSIEEFNSKVRYTIETNDEYKRFIDDYNNFITYKKEMAEIIKEKNQTFINLQEKRRLMVCDPFSKASIEEIDILILQSKTELDIAVRELEEARLKMEELKSRPENTKILKMLKMVKDYEKSLSTIYEMLEKLKKQIDEKYERLTYLKSQLIEYQTVLMQIEELTDED